MISSKIPSLSNHILQRHPSVPIILDVLLPPAYPRILLPTRKGLGPTPKDDAFSYDWFFNEPCHFHEYRPLNRRPTFSPDNPNRETTPWCLSTSHPPGTLYDGWAEPSQISFTHNFENPSFLLISLLPPQIGRPLGRLPRVLPLQSA